MAGDRDTISTEFLISKIGKNIGKSPFLIEMPTVIISILNAVKPELILRLYGSLEMDIQDFYDKLEFVPPYSSGYGIKQMVDWYENHYCTSPALNEVNIIT